MKDVILFCGAGITSSTVIKHLQTVAHKRGIEIKLSWATFGLLATDKAKEYIHLENAGLILVAPHVPEAVEIIKRHVPKQIPVCLLEEKYLGNYEALFNFCLCKLE